MVFIKLYRFDLPMEILCLVGLLLQTMTIAWLLFHMRNQIARKCNQLINGVILGYLIDPISSMLQVEFYTLIAKLRILLNQDSAEVRRTLIEMRENLEEIRNELKQVRTELEEVRTELVQFHNEMV